MAVADESGVALSGAAASSGTTPSSDEPPGALRKLRAVLRAASLVNLAVVLLAALGWLAGMAYGLAHAADSAASALLLLALAVGLALGAVPLLSWLPWRGGANRWALWAALAGLAGAWVLALPVVFGVFFDPGVQDLRLDARMAQLRHAGVRIEPLLYEEAKPGALPGSQPGVQLGVRVSHRIEVQAALPDDEFTYAVVRLLLAPPQLAVVEPAGPGDRKSLLADGWKLMQVPLFSPRAQQPVTRLHGQVYTPATRADTSRSNVSYSASLAAGTYETTAELFLPGIDRDAVTAAWCWRYNPWEMIPGNLASLQGRHRLTVMVDHGERHAYGGRRGYRYLHVRSPPQELDFDVDAWRRQVESLGLPACDDLLKAREAAQQEQDRRKRD